MKLKNSKKTRERERETTSEDRMRLGRQSNLELLRIVSMLFIIMLHIGAASIGLPAPLQTTTSRDIWVLIVESFSIIGVNCFALISGYFGIKASWRSFARFTLLCVVYAVSIYTLLAVLDLVPWSWNTWIKKWLVYTHSELWYVPAYLGLFLLSPFLNQATPNKWTLIGFLVFNIWCGWLWKGNFNPTGYTIMQLIMMYLTGGYIKRQVDFKTNRRQIRRISLGVYVATSIAIAIMALYVESQFTFAYNSPLVMLSSIALFLFFTSLDFQSKAINKLASSAFAVYLVHKNDFIFGGILKPVSRHVWENTSLFAYTLFFITFTLGIYFAIFLIDTARQACFSKIAMLCSKSKKSLENK